MLIIRYLLLKQETWYFHVILDDCLAKLMLAQVVPQLKKGVLINIHIYSSKSRHVQWGKELGGTFRNFLVSLVLFVLNRQQNF